MAWNLLELENKLQQQLKRKAEDAEEAKQKKPMRPAKRQKKDNSVSNMVNTPGPGTPNMTGSSIASKTLDELMAAGGDVLPEDSGSAETPAPIAGSRRKPGKPKMLRAPREKKEAKEPKEPKEPRKPKKRATAETIDIVKDTGKELEEIEVVL